MKKKLALLLALVMIVALAVPVTASAEPAESITLFRSDQIKGKRVYTPLYETKLAL